MTLSRKLEWGFDKLFQEGHCAVQVNADRTEPNKPYFSIQVGMFYKDKWSRYLRPHFVRNKVTNDIEDTKLDGERYARLIDQAYKYVGTELRLARTGQLAKQKRG